MNILIGMLAFLVFAVVERLAGLKVGLIAAALTALALCLRDWTGPRRHCGVLELVSLIGFGLLALYAGLTSPDWSLMGVRLTVDVFLLSVMLASMLIGRPFTLGYTKDDTDPAAWLSPAFIRSHYVVSGVWTAALLVVVLGDTLALLLPRLTFVAVAMVVLALAGASRFTARYTRSLRA